MLVHVIADYGVGDLAFSEVVQRIQTLLPDADVLPLSVAPFATLAAGFCIAQLGLNDAPPNTLIYHNVAPREDDDAARQDNAGEKLAFARLPNGTRVVGVNAGYAFSFVRDLAVELRLVRVPDAGSQFRSRDVFPEGLAALVRGEPDALGEELSRDDVPDVPASHIAYVDGYGNIKTTIAHTGDAIERKTVRVRIGDVELQAQQSDGTFAVEAGTLSFAPGSSGWNSSDDQTLRFFELFLRGGNAHEAFGHPPIGAEIQVS